MRKEELAAMLNGNEYTDEISRDTEKLAQANRLLVIFGASDDLCELRGAIHDEVSAYRGCEMYVTGKGELIPPIDDDDVDTLRKYNALEYVQSLYRDNVKIDGKWCATKEYSWTYETTAPHASFDIMEGSEKYCRGIVLDLKELSHPPDGTPARRAPETTET